MYTILCTRTFLLTPGDRLLTIEVKPDTAVARVVEHDCHMEHPRYL